MYSRRNHRKVRTGCAQCKKRRVKCDEQKPRCAQCTRHQLECQFQTEPLLPHPGTSASPPSTADESSKSVAATSPSHAEEPVSETHYTMADMELLHNYTAATSLTLSSRVDFSHLWQIVVPRIALEYEFLMRGLLALSSLHLGYLNPQHKDDYIIKAATHQDMALKAFRAIMPTPTEDSCDAIFAFSSLLVIYAFASPRNPGSLLLTAAGVGEGSAEWVHLIRGVHSIMVSGWQWIARGRLSLLLQAAGSGGQPEVFENPEDSYLSQLLGLCTEESKLEPGEKEAYAHSIASLRQYFAITHHDGVCEVSVTLIWPVVVPQNYITLLSERQPQALVILAHYCVMLKRLEKYWWMGAWPSNTLSTIYDMLEPEWRSWVQWPMDEIGLQKH